MLSVTFTFPWTLRRAEHRNLVLSIFVYFLASDNFVKIIFPGYECELQQKIMKTLKMLLHFDVILIVKKMKRDYEHIYYSTISL